MESSRYLSVPIVSQIGSRITTRPTNYRLKQLGRSLLHYYQTLNQRLGIGICIRIGWQQSFHTSARGNKKRSTVVGTSAAHRNEYSATVARLVYKETRHTRSFFIIGLTPSELNRLRTLFSKMPITARQLCLVFVVMVFVRCSQVSGK